MTDAELRLECLKMAVEIASLSKLPNSAIANPLEQVKCIATELIYCVQSEPGVVGHTEHEARQKNMDNYYKK